MSPNERTDQSLGCQIERFVATVLTPPEHKAVLLTPQSDSYTVNLSAAPKEYNLSFGYVGRTDVVLYGG